MWVRAVWNFSSKNPFNGLPCLSFPQKYQYTNIYKLPCYLQFIYVFTTVVLLTIYYNGILWYILPWYSLVYFNNTIPSFSSYMTIILEFLTNLPIFHSVFYTRVLHTCFTRDTWRVKCHASVLIIETYLMNSCKNDATDHLITSDERSLTPCEKLLSDLKCRMRNYIILFYKLIFLGNINTL